MKRDTVHQSLTFGPVTLTAADDNPAPYFLAGRKLYAVGTTDGALEPIGAEHLVGEMGGVWAHPVKFLDGWYLAVEDDRGRDDLLKCTTFEGHLSDVALGFEHCDLQIQRTDFVDDEHAALFSLLSITNDGTERWRGTLDFAAQVNILPTWFGGWDRGNMELIQEHGLVLAYDTLWQGRWGVAFGSATMPAAIVFGRRAEKPTAELRYKLELQPGEQVDLEFLVVCDHQNGHEGALHLFRRLVGRGAELLDQKRRRYLDAALGGVTLDTPDEQTNTGWILAKANLHMLEADYGPYLPGFFLAGIPEYPQLFGCDNTYTTPGATGAGFTPTMRSTLSLLGEYARRACGRVPHEVTTNGRVFNPGNTQETPQFAIAVWDYVRWTGDLAFLRVMYPLCYEGVIDYLPGIWDGDGDGYPMGDAMVERTGMGSLKLDSACYLYSAWRALASMARLLDRPEADQLQEMADDWKERFERDWWMPEHGMYADSLHSDYRPQLDGHWTQVVPIQLGIADGERAKQVLDAIERDLTNRWGLVHTRDKEERVWTLPTGLLALAAAHHGRAEYALRMLHNIAYTARTGMLGAFKELIPEGLCFVQLWSAGLYLQGILEGLIGLDPEAYAHRLTITPVLPESWSYATLRRLQIGTHCLNLHITPATATVEHLSGTQPIEIVVQPVGTTVAGRQATTTPAERPATHVEHQRIHCTLAVGQTADIAIHDGTGSIRHADGVVESLLVR